MKVHTLALSLLPLIAVSLPALAAEKPLTVAQVEAEVHIGRNGERIYVNPFTGEVVAVEPARRIRRCRPRGQSASSRWPTCSRTDSTVR